MQLNEYQERAMQTRMITCNNYVYMSEGLDGEVGEFKGKIAKLIRKGKANVFRNAITIQAAGMERDEIMDSLKAELGDVLWFVAGLASIFSWDLEAVAQQNIDKLAARKVAGTIDGNGDGIDGTERTV